MRLSIHPSVLALFPEVAVGAAAIRGFRNDGEDPSLTQALRRAEAALPARFAGTPPSEHPRIALWREAYRRFGAKPKDHPSSVENLARRVLKGWTVPHVNRLVDLYNALSLETLLPAGAEDLDAIVGDVELTLAGENEPAVRLLGEAEERSPRPGEVIYRDGVGAICRRWNWKEADRTKLSPSTVNALVVVEGLPPVGREEIAGTLAEAARRIRASCGGEVETFVLDRDRPVFELSPAGA
jgi:DNA/RNA-binding domain of Phe-tRNA-synthetase-like protein